MTVTRHPLLCDPELNDIPPDVALIDRLEESFGLLTQPRLDLAGRFLFLLQSEHPRLTALSSGERDGIKRAIMDTLGTTVAHLRDPQSVRLHLEEMGRRHAASGVRAEHYPTAGRILIAAMANVAGDRWSPELEADWDESIQLVAQIMMAGARRPQ
jgi:hemoglobin-like flavoprotein